MQERVKALRKRLGLTQAVFGERIGVKANTITGYESGTRAPSDAIISAICREFGVRREWLAHGDGEMLVPPAPSPWTASAGAMRSPRHSA